MMMKRMICTLASFAMLIGTCPPAQAEYLGELRRDIDWVINVDNSLAGGRTSMTVHYLIGRRDEKEINRDEIEIGLVEAGARTPLIFSKPGRAVRRIIIEVDGPLNTPIKVNVSQNAAYPADLFGRGTLVFNVVD
jgi:hypothetical protein